jgi:hypothetical protein
LDYNFADMIKSAQEYYHDTVERHAALKKDILFLTGEHRVSRQLAEECCELAQACLKFQRTLEWPSDTPLTRHEAELMLIEEFTDVIVCAEVLGLEIDRGLFDTKLQRWKDRLLAQVQPEQEA